MGEAQSGGAIYGGQITYVPTAQWNVGLQVDRTVNVSNITSTPAQGGGIGGIPLSGVVIPISASSQITSVALRSNYTWSEQTSIYGAVGDTRVEYIGAPTVQNSWFGSITISHHITDRLSMSLSYSNITFISPLPGTSLQAIRRYPRGRLQFLEARCWLISPNPRVDTVASTLQGVTEKGFLFFLLGFLRR